MARSEYIYLVHDVDICGDLLVGGFTVKRELVDWLRQHPRPDDRQFRVMRIRDIGTNAWSGLDPTRLDITELLA